MHVKGVTHGDLAMWRLLASFSSLFSGTTLLFWFTRTALISVVSSHSRLKRRKSSDKSTIRYMPSTKRQTDKVSGKLVNMVEPLAADRPDISLRNWWRPKSELQTLCQHVYHYFKGDTVFPARSCCPQVAKKSADTFFKGTLDFTLILRMRKQLYNVFCDCVGSFNPDDITVMS